MTCPCKDLSGPGDAIEVCTRVSAGELNHKLMESEDGAGGGGPAGMHSVKDSRQRQQQDKPGTNTLGEHLQLLSRKHSCDAE
jgi:hypothetical protein